MKKYQKILRNKKVILLLCLLVASAIGLFFYYLSMRGVMPQSTIFFLNDVDLPKLNQKVLIFSPHPDDETIGASGFIINSINNGADVKIVLVTDGNKHGLKDRRYEEFRKSTNILGIKENDLIFLDYPDGKLNQIDQNDIRNNLEKQITDFNPDFIIYPSTIDNHPDHYTVGIKVKKIIASNKNITSYQYLVHYHDFPKPKLYRSNLYLLPPLNAVKFDDEWTRLMLTPEIEHQKYLAMLSYKTQLRVPILKSLMLSSIRKNELFSKEN